MNKNEVKTLVTSLRSCKSPKDIKAAINSQPNWCQYCPRDGSLPQLIEFSESLEFQSVVSNLARMASGSGIRLSGGTITEEVQDHFQRNAMQFVPKALTAFILLGFIPISWHLDAQSGFPVFEVADLRISDFHTLRNKLTNASVTLRLNTELGIYDDMCEIYMVSPPNAYGEIDSHAMRVLPDYELLKIRREEMLREIGRPPLFLLQKRAGVEETQDSPLDQLLYENERRVGLRKRKQDALETTSVSIAGEDVSFLRISDEYEVVGSQYSEQTNQFRNKSATDRFEEQSRLTMRKLYHLLGVPADIVEERRREYGNGRTAADQDFNKSAGRIARIIGQALQLAIDACYHIVAMDDPDVQRQMYYEMESRKAERVLEYLEANKDNELFLQSYDQLSKMFEDEVEPDIEMYRKALGNKRPRVEMNPDTRLSAAELEFLRGSNVFDEEETRRLEAQALGMAEQVEDRKVKRQKNLLDAAKLENEDDDDDDETDGN